MKLVDDYVDECVVTSNAGGGGERVLWAAIACMQREQPELVCVIYTGDVGVKKQDMVNKAKVSIAHHSSTSSNVTFPDPLRNHR